MNIRYDPDADALYIRLKEGKVSETKEVDENTILDYDAEGNVIGIELLFVKERMPDSLRIKVENLAVA